MGSWRPSGGRAPSRPLTKKPAPAPLVPRGPAVGSREPAHRLIPPPLDRSAGQEAVELLRRLGLEPDPWQEDVILAGMGRDRAGRWSASEVCQVVPRQNGKTVPLFARALWGVLNGDRLIRWSAHEFKTAGEAYFDLRDLCEHPSFPVPARFYVSNGKEAIHFANGARLTFIARSRSSGRGMGADLIVLDEALMLEDQHMAALKSTQAARPNPQIWYASSAPIEGSPVLRRLAIAGRRGQVDGLCYLEWCASADDDPSDPQTWAKANPAFGNRLTEAFTRSEAISLLPHDFARERLGIWHESERGGPFPLEVWEACTSKRTRPQAGAAWALAADIAPDRSRATIAAAGELRDGRIVVEVLEVAPGAGWVAQAIAERHDGRVPVLVAANGQGRELAAALERREIPATIVSGADMQVACVTFHDRVVERRLVHLGQQELGAAVEAAAKREIEDSGWVWSRRRSTVDITPLVACTLAAHGVVSVPVRDEIWVL